MLKSVDARLSGVAQFIAATMLAAMFLTFLLQIISRYVLVTPFGWTLELCLTLWVWTVFFGSAFVVREKDHVTFDIVYLAVPKKIRRIFALVSALAIVLAMLWSFLPTLDYIDFLKIRKSATLKIRMNEVFSIYLLFMLVLIVRYSWQFVRVLRSGPPDNDHELVFHDSDGA